MENQEFEKVKEYSRLNNHYLKISLTSDCLILIGFNTEILDNILYKFSIDSEEIKQNSKLKNLSLNQLFGKITGLIEKKKYMMEGDANSIILSLFEGESFDINKDLQFILIKSNEEEQEGTYENAMKKIIMSLKKENANIKKELDDLKFKKRPSADLRGNLGKDLPITGDTDIFKNIQLSKTVIENQPKTVIKEGNNNIQKKMPSNKGRNIVDIQKSFKKKKTFGLNISTLAKLNYNSYPSVELSPSFFNIIAGYGGNSYNGIMRKYNEDKIKIIVDYKLKKPVQKNGQTLDPKISYFAIYDGHGGNKCSIFLQENLHNYIFESDYFPLYTNQAISTAYVKAEEEFLDKATDETGKLIDKSGSCSISALIMDDWCFIINLGDSRALYSFNAGKRLMQVSRDHKPNDPIERERIEKAGGSVYRCDFVMVNGEKVQIDEKNIPEGASIPYRMIPGNIAVRKFIFNIFNS
jgi:hypothetical protein